MQTSRFPPILTGRRLKTNWLKKICINQNGLITKFWISVGPKIRSPAAGGNTNFITSYAEFQEGKKDCFSRHALCVFCMIDDFFVYMVFCFLLFWTHSNHERLLIISGFNFSVPNKIIYTLIRLFPNAKCWHTTPELNELKTLYHLKGR